MTAANDMPRKAGIILALLDTPLIHSVALRAFIEKREAGDTADNCIAAAMTAAKDEIVGVLVSPAAKGDAC